MKRILGAAGALLLLLASATAGLCAGYAEIFYTANEINATTHEWEYSYTVVNPPVAADPADSGIVDSQGGLTWFTIYFPASDYSNVNPAGTLPLHWELQWLPPEYGLDSRYVVGNNPPVYHYAPILPGQLPFGGFDVTFTYTGADTPGPQYFRVNDLQGTAPMLFEGETTLLAVPEPFSLFMLAFGLCGISVVRRKR